MKEETKCYCGHTTTCDCGPEQERSYSEEDMLESFMAGIKCESKNGKNFEQFIKQLKNK